MPRPVDAILSAMSPADPAHQAIVAAVERTLVRHLERDAGRAWSRAELGDAFKDGVGAATGLRVERGLREVFLALAQAMAPPLERAIKATSDVVDLALTNLVRRGEVEVAIVDLQPHFWSTRPRSSLPEGEPGPP
ncbi:MAG: hypothetical protein R3B09_08455 [Nannocystaceae bacterium]